MLFAYLDTVFYLTKHQVHKKQTIINIMHIPNSTSTGLLDDLRSAITNVFVRHGYSPRIVIDSDPTPHPSSEVSKLLIEVSFSSETPPEVTTMDDVFATPITDFLKTASFTPHCAAILNSLFRHSRKFERGPVLVIGDLVDYTVDELYRVNGIGKVMRSRIRSSLDSIGLHLGMRPRIKGPKEIETKVKLLAKP